MMLGCNGLILRLRQNISLQYHYKIKQTSDENKEKDQLGDKYYNSWSNTKFSVLSKEL